MDHSDLNLTRIAIAVLAAVACTTALAGNHLADDKIAVAKASISHAEQAGGPEAAPVGMANAREKLTRAEKANTAHEVKPAAAWAEQADLDAQVAEATATQIRSAKAASDFDAGLQTLRQEAARASQPAN